jgi:hypothetical protein
MSRTSFMRFPFRAPYRRRSSGARTSVVREGGRAHRSAAPLPPGRGT